MSVKVSMGEELCNSCKRERWCPPRILDGSKNIVPVEEKIKILSEITAYERGKWTMETLHAGSYGRIISYGGCTDTNFFLIIRLVNNDTDYQVEFKDIKKIGFSCSGWSQKEDKKEGCNK